MWRCRYCQLMVVVLMIDLNCFSHSKTSDSTRGTSLNHRRLVGVACVRGMRGYCLCSDGSSLGGDYVEATAAAEGGGPVGYYYLPR